MEKLLGQGHRQGEKNGVREDADGKRECDRGVSAVGSMIGVYQPLDCQGLVRGSEAKGFGTQCLYPGPYDIDNSSRKGKGSTWCYQSQQMWWSCVGFILCLHS